MNIPNFISNVRMSGQNIPVNVDVGFNQNKNNLDIHLKEQEKTEEEKTKELSASIMGLSAKESHNMMIAMGRIHNRLLHNYDEDVAMLLEISQKLFSQNISQKTAIDGLTRELIRKLYTKVSLRG